MKPKFLFPHGCKKIGWIFLVPAIIMGLLHLIFGIHGDFLAIRIPVVSLVYYDSFPTFGPEGPEGTVFFWILERNVTPTIIAIVFIISGLLVAFSKEAQEDEYIAKIRLDSLVWATCINYGLLVLSFMFFWGESFLYVMEINMFTILLLFICRFNFIIYRLRRTSVVGGDEKQA